MKLYQQINHQIHLLNNYIGNSLITLSYSIKANVVSHKGM
jgi:hypothetical protein